MIVCPSVPALTVAFTVRVMTEAPLSVPTFHVPCALSYVPLDGVAETNVTPEGKTLVIVTVVDAVNAGAPVRV